MPKRSNPRNSPTAFARRVTERRIELGMSQRDVADASGLTQAAICHFERGRREPNLVNALRVAKALGTTIDHLVGGSEIADRLTALEGRVRALDDRTVGSIVFGGPRR